MWILFHLNLMCDEQFVFIFNEGGRFKVRVAHRIFPQNLVDRRGEPSGSLLRYLKFLILSRLLVMTSHVNFATLRKMLCSKICAFWIKMDTSIVFSVEKRSGYHVLMSLPCLWQNIESLTPSHALSHCSPRQSASAHDN